VLYAKRFWYVLDTGDTAPLSTLPAHRSKEVTLVALANYSKFVGKYDKFQELKKRHGLKWNTSNSTQFFERFFNEGFTLDIMLQRIRNMIANTPTPIPEIIKFACLVGLRASECVEAVRLLNSCELSSQYYNPSRQALEHFRFPQFLRQTKKAYISFITKEQLLGIDTMGPKTPSLNSITLACRRKGIKMEMYLCRKIFASWLRKEGIQPEVVDLLQGRVSQSVLIRHYLVPSNTIKDQVLQAIQKLHDQF
jgi:hypothetical protein